LQSTYLSYVEALGPVSCFEVDEASEYVPGKDVDEKCACDAAEPMVVKSSFSVPLQRRGRGNRRVNLHASICMHDANTM
jgi:hypothetical protein